MCNTENAVHLYIACTHIWTHCRTFDFFFPTFFFFFLYFTDLIVLIEKFVAQYTTKPSRTSK